MLRRLTAWLALAAVVLAVLALACVTPDTRPLVCEEGTPGCEGPPAETPGGGTSGGGAPTSTTPTTSGGPSSSSGTVGDGGYEAEAASPVDSGKDSSPPAQDSGSCKATGGACFHVQNECGCASDCCSGLDCSHVGGLLVTWCCAPMGKGCGSDSDCCGNGLCRGTPGAMTCQ